MAERAARRDYLDWLRGLAVLVMIEAHLLDSWTRAPDRESQPFAWAMILGGMGAPLFLFLAGVAVPLSAGSKARRVPGPSSDRIASVAVIRRGLQIFGLALLFRVQALVLGWGPWRDLFKVDILNIMGPSIVAAAALWGALRTPRSRLGAFLLCACALGLATPIVRGWTWLGALPDPIEAYIRPVRPLSNFVLFPWAGLLFAGAAVGLLLDAARSPGAERRLNAWLAVAGAAVTSAALMASYLPSPYARSDFWTSSPSYFFIRAGLVTLLVPLAFAWGQRPGGRRWSPLRQLGRTSLFVYWIHVELIYGLISVPLHKSLGFGAAWLAFGGFALLMLAASLGKDAVVRWWRPPAAVRAG